MSIAQVYEKEWQGDTRRPPSSTLPLRLPLSTVPILAGFGVTLLQLALALLLLAPEMPLRDRYQTLVQHDGYWFANIVDRGYATIVPPIAHKMMEVSNVAFFPAYPMLATLVRFCFGLGTSDALLIAAQISAWGFWSYFFLFCQRWQITVSAQFLGALVLAAHPAAFFLIAAYSESLFLFALLGFLYWSAGETRRDQLIACCHGIVMSGTRIVGLACALAPVVQRGCELGWSGVKEVRQWLRRYSRATLVSAAATLGGIAFFVYCQFRWGRWDIYMLTQQFGWAVEPDYVAVFKPSNYRWLVPSLVNPTQMSQMAMTLGALMLLAVGLLECRPAQWRSRSVITRMPIYFAAFVIYFISVSGVASVEMESMLRYELCVHALIVLALLHYLHHLPVRSRIGRAAGVTAIAVSCAAGLALEGWYIWNFTRGNWVA